MHEITEEGDRAMIERHNFFRFATTEMSNSAFWGWVLQSADADDPSLQEVRRLAEIVLRDLAIAPVPPIKVTLEYLLKGHGRIDLHWQDASGNILLIENKVSAIPDEQQCRNYTNSANTHIGIKKAIFSIANDDLDREKIPVDWIYIDIGKQIAWMEEISSAHPILRDFRNFLVARHSLRQAERQDVMSSDPVRYNRGFETHAGQTEFMLRLKSFLGEDFIYKPSIEKNANFGYPAYQLWFYYPPDDGKLLFRLDVRASRWCLMLRLYKDDQQLLDNTRFNRISELWAAAVQESQAILIPSRIPELRLKQRECNVAKYDFDANPPTVLLQEIPKALKAFMPAFLSNPKATSS